MIAWMHSWENRVVPNDFKWCGMMTIPRELNIKDGRLIQTPIREIENYYKNTIEYTNLLVEEDIELNGVLGRELDLRLDIDARESEEFEIKIAKNDEYETIIKYIPKENLIYFDRTYSGVYGDILHTREMKVSDNNKRINLRLIIDKYSVEIFANEGQQVMTSTFYTPLEATGISFSSKGKSIISVKKHDIKFN